VDLHIEVYYTYAIPLSYFQREAHNSAVFQQLGAKYKSKLGWLKSLKSLVIIPHYQNDPESPHNYSYQDPFIVELLKWMFESQDLLPSSLERLWIPEAGFWRVLQISSEFGVLVLQYKSQNRTSRSRSCARLPDRGRRLDSG